MFRFEVRLKRLFPCEDSLIKAAIKAVALVSRSHMSPHIAPRPERLSTVIAFDLDLLGHLQSNGKNFDHSATKRHHSVHESTDQLMLERLLHISNIDGGQDRPSESQ